MNFVAVGCNFWLWSKTRITAGVQCPLYTMQCKTSSYDNSNKLKQVDIAYSKAIIKLLMSKSVLVSGLPWNTTMLWRIASIWAFTLPGCWTIASVPARVMMTTVSSYLKEKFFIVTVKNMSQCMLVNTEAVKMLASFCCNRAMSACMQCLPSTLGYNPNQEKEWVLQRKKPPIHSWSR